MGLKEMFSGVEKTRSKGMYSVYDTKTGLHSPPVVFENDEEALRSMRQYVNDPQGTTPMHKFPKDFTFVCVGLWEEKSGKIIPGDPKIIENIGNLREEREQK